MSEQALLANHLDQQAEAILAVWRDTVSRVGDVPDAERLSYAEFLDHVPRILERLGDRLRGQPAGAGAEAKQHGQHRWRQGYDIAEIVNEFGHLRTALTKATFDFARRHKWASHELEGVCEAIHDVIDEATAESVRQFQEDSRAETQAALAQAKERQAALEDAWIAARAEKLNLRTILAHLPVAVWVVDAGGTVIGVNDEAQRMHGIPQKDLVGQANVHRLGPEYQVLRPDGSACPNDAWPIVRALRGETVVHEELVWVVRGVRRPVSVNAAPLFDQAGAITGAVEAVEDIAERLRAEEQIQRQLVFSRTLTETLGEGLCAVDLERRVTFANQAAVAMFGWTEAELLGRDLHAMVHFRHPDGTPYPAEQCPLEHVLRTGETRQGDEVYIRKDGSTFFVVCTASPLVIDGRIVGAIQAFRDISERKQLEESLADSEARFRTIAEKSPVMIWRVDASGVCDYVNQTWCDFRGRSFAEEVEDGWPQGVHPDDAEACLARFRAAFERREPFEQTYRVRRRDGQYRWVSDRGMPYHDVRGTFLGYLGSCLDITERIELEEALDRQRELAEEASQHKTRLVSALSHDARTPLNAVVLAAQLLNVHLEGSSNPEVQDCLRTIRHSVNNVLDLIGDLLDLSKIDAGVLPPDLSRFPLEPVLAECLASIETQARLKGLDVVLEPGALAGATIETDRAKLKQVLNNLLSNALKFTKHGHIRLRGERTAEEVCLSVEDTGVGIDPADQARIFEEFTTLQDPKRPRGEGTGLGLAICRRLATLLGGDIRLRSAPGAGSTFTLVLPAAVIRETAPQTLSSSTTRAHAADEGAVLIAEDHLDSRQTLAKVLRRMGYRVLEADNGRDVLDLAGRERLLAILMDVNMPIMDGIDTTLSLRADSRFHNLPIFALTGDVTPENQHRIGQAGVSGYLEKPVTWEILERALGSLGKPKAD